MLTLRALLSLPTFLSTALIAHALALPDGLIESSSPDGADPPRPEYAVQLTGGEECDSEQLAAIREGFADMNVLFAGAQNPNFTGDIEQQFFGNLSRIESYTSLIADNLRRAARYGAVKGDGGDDEEEDDDDVAEEEEAEKEARMPDIHVRCDDVMDFCGERRFDKRGGGGGGKHYVYNIGNGPHINFCRKYFRLKGLRERVDKKAGNNEDKSHLMEYYNRGTAWARQIMHISEVGHAVVEKIVSGTGANTTSGWVMSKSIGPMNTSVLAGVRNERPDGFEDVQTLKYAYGAARAKLLAVFTTQEPYDAANNAENYALYALARYVLQEKNIYPNFPIMSFDTDMAVLMNNGLQEGEEGRRRYADYDSPDVIAAKPGMEIEGKPLPSAAMSTKVWRVQPGLLLMSVFFWYFALSVMG